jgi:glycosyltransferase involved in cell wall biosynthesis
MHVVLVTDTFETGGGLEQLFQTVKTLKQVRFSLCARGGEARHRFTGLENAAVHAEGFGRARLMGLKPDLIHFHHLRPLLQFFAVPVPACGVPLLFTAHGLHIRKYDHRPGARNGAVRLVRAVLEQKLYRKVDRVIAVSREDEGRLRSLYGLENTVHIPNGVDVRALEGAPQCCEAFRRELHLPLDATVFLTVARFDFQKGYDILVEAIRLGRDRFLESGVRFVLAGDGRELPAVRRRAEQGQVGELVRFPGERTDAGRMMKSSDLFVLPSRWEGLPLSLLEAAFCRLPVVASDTCGNREIVRDGVNGLLFENGDPQSLCRALVSMIDPGRRVSLCSTAPDREFRHRYDIAETSRILERLYRECAG